MSEDSSALSDLKSKVLLAKLLLLKYGVMHSFHEQQLEYYLIACCCIAIDGTVSVLPSTKTVKFEIMTEKFFYKERKQTKKRHKLATYFNVAPWKYKKECSVAVKNLDMWCKELLWGDDTTVIVTVDGVRSYV